MGFKADKEWQGKKEANVLEALVGELKRVRHTADMELIVALALLTYLDPPINVLPSNWYMRERRVLRARKLLRVALRKATPQDKCGFKFVSAQGVVSIETVREGGLLAKWNDTRLDAHTRVGPGSRIIEANGETDCKAISKVLLRSGEEPLTHEVVLEVIPADGINAGSDWQEIGRRHFDSRAFEQWAIQRLNCS